MRAAPFSLELQGQNGVVEREQGAEIARRVRPGECGLNLRMAKTHFPGNVVPVMFWIRK
jgi:hypothetical protein